LQGSGGKQFRLSQYAGKVIVLALMHTTCKHCQDLTRLLVPLQQDYAKRNVQVIEVAFNDDAPMTMGPFFEVFKPNFPVGLANDATIRNYLKWDDKKDGMLYVPRLVFIDPSGMITSEHGENEFFGPAVDKNIRSVLDKMLGKPAAPAAPVKKK